MVDEATTIEEKTPVKLVEGPVVTALLGTVKVAGKTLKGVGNNTRWVVDIDATSGDSVTIECVDYFGSHEIEPDVMSFSITPLSFVGDTQLWGVQEGASLTIMSVTNKDDDPRRFQCRVSIDIIHRS